MSRGVLRHNADKERVVIQRRASTGSISLQMVEKDVETVNGRHGKVHRCLRL